MYKQFYDYFDIIFSRNQCGFRKGFIVVNCLLPMIEKWRESFDQGGAYGALLTDFSKAFDCLRHEFIIAKLYAYGVENGLKLMIFIAHGLKYFLGYLRALFLVHYYSLYLYVTFLCSYPKMVLLITLIIIPHIQQVKEITTSYLIENKSQTFCRIGSRIII